MPRCKIVAVVMAGGACGAVARTVADAVLMGAVLPNAMLPAAAPGFLAVFPLGVLGINIIGSFCMGLLAGRAARSVANPVSTAFLGTGFLGGFTTFSTFALDTVQLVGEFPLVAALYAAGSIAGGVMAAWSGWHLSAPAGD